MISGVTTSNDGMGIIVHTPALAGLVRGQGRVKIIFWAYLLLATAGELLTSLVSIPAGLGLHCFLLLTLLVHSVLGSREIERKLAMALALAPLIRLLSLLLPLVDFPQVVWYPLVAVPLLVGAWLIAQQAGFTRREVGLTPGRLPLQLLLCGGGLALGIVEYSILQPRSIVANLDATSFILTALSLLLFTGFTEEVIFRGLMQSAAGSLLGRWGIPFVSLLFGVLHIGYLSILDVLFVTSVGLLFAYLAQWGNSILGVTLAHGLTNVTLFVIMPTITKDASGLMGFFYGGALVCTLAAVWAAKELRRTSIEKVLQAEVGLH